jgi:quinol monooxygenase YgiN
MPGKINVVVTIRFKQGFLHKGLEALKKCQEITLLEKGCDFYNLWVDVNTANLEEGERVYYLLEQWADQESLDDHMTKEHTIEWIKALHEFSNPQASVCKFIQ